MIQLSLFSTGRTRDRDGKFTRPDVKEAVREAVRARAKALRREIAEELRSRGKVWVEGHERDLPNTGKQSSPVTTDMGMGV